jgi:hypothetical protein
VPPVPKLGSSTPSTAAAGPEPAVTPTTTALTRSARAPSTALMRGALDPDFGVRSALVRSAVTIMIQAPLQNCSCRPSAYAVDEISTACSPAPKEPRGRRAVHRTRRVRPLPFQFRVAVKGKSYEEGPPQIKFEYEYEWITLLNHGRCRQVLRTRIQSHTVRRRALGGGPARKSGRARRART